ncbi:hypothetical protein G4Y79_15150 [Phototrophicus methaneseepsis]|uniref:Uncharacterized protein n=1 Tax=Phototrophicus methaneseepsis TaxID=2710758 RepID=A0A7S8E616_9CHLR|nr:hypothetical protein [Phototrophicus methaneseepsis]QPC81039.1 hypothetical protein G4Y79_15150 [Phototrophicus methaneseepsis]
MDAKGFHTLRNMLQIEYAAERDAIEKTMPDVSLSYMNWLELKVLRSKVTPAEPAKDNRIRAKIQTFAEGQIMRASRDGEL